ncbi:helix-turn-helix domain-containing protein [Miltoncostaea marina]|uniref:helix-turn-helix domain-containing protein n=1 Tax=Miltoncostaea marina TaxID=2843215 RepID=UPI001C3D51BA|nr:helix-turn-helix domain-containing protein [Miltoncostaea marina]
MGVRATSADERAERDIGRLAAALGDPTRRRVFFAVRAAGAEQTKDDIAREVGIDRRLAGFHLDKLVEHGFLEAGFRRPEGRGGPGAGRPAKRYRLAERELLVPLPERHYELLATLLLRATREAEVVSQEVLERVGHDFGFEIGLAEVAAGRQTPPASLTEATEGVVRLLSRYGFAARAEGAGGLRACACPFEELAFDDPARICGLDRAIWRGMLAALAPDATLSVSATRARGDDACLATVDASETAG